jgi:4'-phosphopantetheinyl transferase
LSDFSGKLTFIDNPSRGFFILKKACRNTEEPIYTDFYSHLSVYYILYLRWRVMKNIVHIFYIHQAEKLSDIVFQQFLLQLPIFFQTNIKAYKHWQSAQASLVGKMILKYALQQLQISATLHDIKISSIERPYINEEIDFNISHSGDYIICAISLTAKVGIDIEKHRKINIDLFKKYFSDDERSEIQNASIPQQAFFDLWAIKESAIKCDGRGVEILSKTHKKYGSYHQIQCDLNNLYYQPFMLLPQYSACVCSTHLFQTHLTQLSISDLQLL